MCSHVGNMLIQCCCGPLCCVSTHSKTFSIPYTPYNHPAHIQSEKPTDILPSLLTCLAVLLRQGVVWQQNTLLLFCHALACSSVCSVSSGCLALKRQRESGRERERNNQLSFLGKRQNSCGRHMWSFHSNQMGAIVERGKERWRERARAGEKRREE